MKIIGMMVRLVRHNSRIAYKSVKEKMGQVSQIVCGRITTQEIIKKSKENCLIIKVRKIGNSTLDVLKCMFIVPYKVLDTTSKIKYKANYKVLGNLREYVKGVKIIRIYNCDNVDIGYVKIDYKECNDAIRYVLYMEDKKIAAFRKYKDSNKLDIDSLEDVKINYNKLNAYHLKFKNRELAKLNVARIKEENLYTEKYVLEYEDKKDEILVVLLSIATDIINS